MILKLKKAWLNWLYRRADNRFSVAVFEFRTGRAGYEAVELAGKACGLVKERLEKLEKQHGKREGTPEPKGAGQMVGRVHRPMAQPDGHRPRRS